MKKTTYALLVAMVGFVVFQGCVRGIGPSSVPPGPLPAGTPALVRWATWDAPFPNGFNPWPSTPLSFISANEVADISSGTGAFVFCWVDNGNAHSATSSMAATIEVFGAGTTAGFACTSEMAAGNASLAGVPYVFAAQPSSESFWINAVQTNGPVNFRTFIQDAANHISIYNTNLVAAPQGTWMNVTVPTDPTASGSWDSNFTSLDWTTNGIKFAGGVLVENQNLLAQINIDDVYFNP